MISSTATPPRPEETSLKCRKDKGYVERAQLAGWELVLHRARPGPAAGSRVDPSCGLLAARAESLNGDGWQGRQTVKVTGEYIGTLGPWTSPNLHSFNRCARSTQEVPGAMLSTTGASPTELRAMVGAGTGMQMTPTP